MTQKWTWTGRYVLAAVTALVLGGVIGEMSLFKQATLGTPKLTAASLVTVMGYGAALGLLWLLSHRAAHQLRTGGGRTAFLGLLLIPLATLIIVSSTYGVALVILKPFLDAGLRNTYNWLFVLAITVSAIWFIVALFHHSEPLMALFKSAGASAGAAKPHCRGCTAPLVEGAKFCYACGSGAS